MLIFYKLTTFWNYLDFLKIQKYVFDTQVGEVQIFMVTINILQNNRTVL